MGRPGTKSPEAGSSDKSSESGRKKSGPRAGSGDRPAVDGSKRRSGDKTDKTKTDKSDKTKTKPKSDKTQTGPKTDKTQTRPKATGDRSKGYGEGPKKPASRTGAKASPEYKPGELKGTGKENWKTERGGHTRAAEKAGRAEVKAATGKDAKIASQKRGQKVEHHHHSGVKESRQVKLNPKVAGERSRTTAVHSSKSDKVFGASGDKPKFDPKSKDRVTHHTRASRIDKAEQARVAKKLGAKGDNPRLPKTDAGRKGLVDASATSKWRWPATADQTERAKQKWERKEPAGPKVDSKGRVVPDKPTPRSAQKGDAPKASSKADAPKPSSKADAPKGSPKADVPKPSSKADAPKGSPKADVPKPAPKADAPKPAAKADAPKPAAKIDAPKAPGKVEVPNAPGKLGEVFGKLGRAAGAAGRAAGVAGNIAGSAGEVAESVARNRPEWLPEGAKVPLYRSKPDLPIFKERTGYTVEKTDGKVIYRGPDGKEVSKDEALRASDDRYAGEA